MRQWNLVSLVLSDCSCISFALHFGAHPRPARFEIDTVAVIVLIVHLADGQISYVNQTQLLEPGFHLGVRMMPLIRRREPIESIADSNFAIRMVRYPDGRRPQHLPKASLPPPVGG